MSKFLIAIFVLLGVSAVYGASIRRDTMDPRAVLAEIDNTPFGNTVLSLVSVHLSSNSPIDELVVLLNQIRTEIAKDQEEDDNTNRTNQANCDVVIASYQQQIATFTNQRNENIKIRDINQAALTIAQKDLAETIAALNLNAKRLSQGQAERDQQHNDYAESIHDREAGIKALDGALQLLQHLQSGTSFVQLKRRFEKVTAELIETSKTSKRGHLYTPLIAALSELASKASPEMITKIVALFNDLRSTFVKDQQVATNIENQQMESWTSLRADLETEKDQLTGKRADLERQIEGYTAIINECNKNITYLNEQLELATANLQHTENDCNAKSEQYAHRSLERTREEDIISRVVSFLQKRAKGATEFIQERVQKSSL